MMARIRNLLAVVAIGGITVLVGALLRAWTGFPKGTDAAAHLTRLKFVADWFPSQDWLYAWAAGMPTFGISVSPRVCGSANLTSGGLLAG